MQQVRLDEAAWWYFNKARMSCFTCKNIHKILWRFFFSLSISFLDADAQRDLSPGAPGGSATLTLSWAPRPQSWLCPPCLSQLEQETTTRRQESSTSLEPTLGLWQGKMRRLALTVMETRGKAKKTLQTGWLSMIDLKLLRSEGDSWKDACNSCGCGPNGLTFCTTAFCGPIFAKDEGALITWKCCIRNDPTIFRWVPVDGGCHQRHFPDPAVWPGWHQDLSSCQCWFQKLKGWPNCQTHPGLQHSDAGKPFFWKGKITIFSFVCRCARLPQMPQLKGRVLDLEFLMVEMLLWASILWLEEHTVSFEYKITQLYWI